MNLSKSGVSWTLGPRGASVGVGKRGTYLNTGVPGTGIYSRSSIAGSAPQSRASSGASYTSMSVAISVEDDGTITYKDQAGDPLPPNLVTTLKRQQGEAIRGLIEGTCDKINASVEAVAHVHLATPAPDSVPRFTPVVFPDTEPSAPIPKKAGLLEALFKSRRTRLEQENTDRQENYLGQMKAWQSAKEAFERTQAERKDLIERLIYTDMDAMNLFLEETLQGIEWPRETDVSVELHDAGTLAVVDVDLPEIEDLPDRTASVPQHSYKLTVKMLPLMKRQALYATHVHGVVFLIIGEVFAALPKTTRVVLSAYTQRADAATGRLEDQFIISVDADRTVWARIDFTNLPGLDVAEALAQFGLRRDLSKAGVFKAIEPIRVAQ
jgi:hypothetical protein